MVDYAEVAASRTVDLAEWLVAAASKMSEVVAVAVWVIAAVAARHKGKTDLQVGGRRDIGTAFAMDIGTAGPAEAVVRNIDAEVVVGLSRLVATEAEEDSLEYRSAAARLRRRTELAILGYRRASHMDPKEEVLMAPMER